MVVVAYLFDQVTILVRINAMLAQLSEDYDVAWPMPRNRVRNREIPGRWINGAAVGKSIGPYPFNAMHITVWVLDYRFPDVVGNPNVTIAVDALA
jgi:hypothetical protein